MAIFGFYLKMGIEFGNAAKESIKAIELAKNDWEKEKVNPIDSIKLRIEAMINNPPKNCNDTFEAFFEQFSEDSIFQKSRIKYPLKWSYIKNLEIVKSENDSIYLSDFKYIDFTESGDYINEINKINDTLIECNRASQENKVFEIYEFSKINGCWFLAKKITDKLE